MNSVLKIRYLSDLHLEFIKPDRLSRFINKIPVATPDEICVLAGDIGNPYEPNYDTFMKFINSNFKKSFIVAGNHEFYNKTKSIDDTILYLHQYFTKFENITFLDNSFEIYENHCFIGSTLWSKITDPDHEINDIYYIPNFTIDKYNFLNEKSVENLEMTLQNNNNCIVITHHVPSYDLIDSKYKTKKMMPYNQWFYCDMNNTITKNQDKIKCWFYGHTHSPSTQNINGIPFLCNPIGYPNENHSNDFNKKIIIPM